MSKPGNLPPPTEAEEPAKPVTPAPAVRQVDDLVNDADPTLEWSIADLIAEGGGRAFTPAEGVGSEDDAATAYEQFRWGVTPAEGIPAAAAQHAAAAAADGQDRATTPVPLYPRTTAPMPLLDEEELGSIPTPPPRVHLPASLAHAPALVQEQLQVQVHVDPERTPPPDPDADADLEATRAEAPPEEVEEDLLIDDTPPPTPIIEITRTPPPAPPAAAVMATPAPVPMVESVPPRTAARPPAPPPVPPPAPPSVIISPALGPPAGPPPAALSAILLPELPVDISGGTPIGAWPEALSQRTRKKRLRPWFEEVFDEDYLRTLPFMTAEQTLREVAFIKDALSPPEDGHILDVACGYGRHAIELSQRGLRVTGLDLSLPLLIRAADESQRRSLSVNFVHADMREMAFDTQFDGAYCMLSSFGYFDEETNLKVAASVCKALRPGARFLVDTINRDYIVGDLPTRVWWEGDGCVVLEEVDFNFHTSRVNIRRSVVFQDGRQVEQDISIRAYSLHEMGKMMRQAGFRVLDVSGSLATKGHFFGATSRNLLMVCERPAS